MHLLGKIDNRELIYDIGFAINFCIVFLQITIQTIPFSRAFIFLCISLFCVVILNTKYTKKEIILWGIIILFMVFFFAVRNDSNPLRIALMIMAARNIDKEAFFVFYRWLLLISIVVALILAFNGYRYFYVDDYWGLNRGFERRYLLGFDGPNRVNCIFLAIILSTVCSKYKKQIQVLIFAILLCILFLFTKSRTGLFAGLIFLFYPAIEQLFLRVKKFNSILNKMPYVILFGILAITLFVSIGIDNDSIQKWNIIFNNRFINLYKAKELFNVSPMGIDIPNDSVGGLDNSYFLNFYSWGYILYSLYICLIVRMIIVFNKMDNARLRGALITYIVLPFVIEIIHLSSINGIYILCIAYYKVIFGVNDDRYLKKSEINTSGKICLRSTQ